MVSTFLSKISKRRRIRKGFQRMVYNLEGRVAYQTFLRAQLRQVREGMRVEYDRMRELMDAAQSRINSEKESKTPDLKIVETMNKSLQQLTQDSEQVKKQMDAIDSQIDAPEGPTQMIEKYQTSINQILDYMKKSL